MNVASRPRPRSLTHRARAAAALALVAGLTVASVAAPAAAEGPDAVRINPAFSANALPANDDGSTSLVPVGFDLDFFGNTYSQVYVNNNGNLTFDGPLSTFTPSAMDPNGLKIIAAFFADVDTRAAGSGLTRYGYGTGQVDGHDAFGATWVDVGYFPARDDKLNSFQIVLVEREDVAPGAFDIELNYDKVQWESGTASGGSGGLGGISARAGFSSGTGTAFELPGSGVNGALLDTNLAGGLIYGSIGTTQLGRYVFNVRNGVVVPVDNPPTVAVDNASVGTDEGTEATNTGTHSDPDGDPVTLSASVGIVTDTGSGTWSWSHTPDDGPADSGPVTVTATANGLSSTATFQLDVANVAPTVTALSPSTLQVVSGSPVTFQAAATDPSGADTTTGFDWSFDGGAFGTSDSFTTSFDTCGAHTVTATARDKDGGVSAPFTSATVSAIDSGFLAPIKAGAYNKVQGGRVLPVKISAVCDGAFDADLAPSIQLLSGNTDASTDPGDGTTDVATESVSNADTTGVMRVADDHYIYDLRIPAAPSGTLYTVRVRPFGTAAGGSIYAVLQVR